MLQNSVKFIVSPSPSLSAIDIISSISSSVHTSLPIISKVFFRSYLFSSWSPSRSNILKASTNSSSVSTDRIFVAIRLRNSGNSSTPLPSVSTSLIISSNSSSLGCTPSDWSSARSSSVPIEPLLSASKI